MKKLFIILSFITITIACTSEDSDSVTSPEVPTTPTNPDSPSTQKNYMLTIRGYNHSLEWLSVTKSTNYASAYSACSSSLVKSGDKFKIFGDIPTDKIEVEISENDSDNKKIIILTESKKYLAGDFSYRHCYKNGTVSTNGGLLWEDSNGQTEFTVE